MLIIEEYFAITSATFLLIGKYSDLLNCAWGEFPSQRQNNQRIPGLVKGQLNIFLNLFLGLSHRQGQHQSQHPLDVWRLSGTVPRPFAPQFIMHIRIIPIDTNLYTADGSVSQKLIYGFRVEECSVSQQGSQWSGFFRKFKKPKSRRFLKDFTTGERYFKDFQSDCFFG